MEIPTDLIESAEQVGQRPCRDHTHPVVRLNLKQPKDPEAQILAQLLTSSGPSPMGSWSPGGGLPILGGSPAASGPFAPGEASRVGGVTVGPQRGVTVGPQSPGGGGVPLALGCGPCTTGRHMYQFGDRTCLYLECYTIGGRNYYHVVSYILPCNAFEESLILFG